MTLAEKLHREGHREGHQEGRQEGRLMILRENVLDALKLRFDSVPDGVSEAVSAVAEEETLRELLRRAIRCESVEDFAAGL